MERTSEPNKKFAVCFEVLNQSAKNDGPNSTAKRKKAGREVFYAGIESERNATLLTSFG